jgi:nucleotide-binding universal stress UspA family protein
MFKHILIPTDGSETADKAVKAGLDFARWAKARVTVFNAQPEYRMPTTSEVAAGNVMPPQEYERRALEQARKLLARISRRAKAAGVTSQTESALSDTPWQAIIRAAEKHGCDLIFIGSHGRKGLSALVHGSETYELLKHSTIPTLVVR